MRIVKEELRKHPNACNHFAHHVADRLGFDLPDYLANEQIDFMTRTWKAARVDTAQAVANIGELAVAGQPGNPNGHTAIVVPTLPRFPQAGVARVACGSTNANIRTDGRKNPSKIWHRGVPVMYFVPKETYEALQLTD